MTPARASEMAADFRDKLGTGSARSRRIGQPREGPSSHYGLGRSERARPARRRSPGAGTIEAEHRPVYAITSGDPDRADAAMRLHLLYARDRALRNTPSALLGRPSELS